MSRFDDALRTALIATRDWGGFRSPDGGLTAWDALIADAFVVSTTETSVTWSLYDRVAWWEATGKRHQDGTIDLVTRVSEVSPEARAQLRHLGWAIEPPAGSSRYRLPGRLIDFSGRLPTSLARQAVADGFYAAVCSVMSLGPCCLSLLFTNDGPRRRTASRFHAAITRQDISRALNGDPLWTVGHLAGFQVIPQLISGANGVARLASKQTGGVQPYQDQYVTKYARFVERVRNIWNETHP